MDPVGDLVGLAAGVEEVASAELIAEASRPAKDMDFSAMAPVWIGSQYRYSIRTKVSGGRSGVPSPVTIT